MVWFGVGGDVGYGGRGFVFCFGYWFGYVEFLGDVFVVWCVVGNGVGVGVGGDSGFGWYDWVIGFGWCGVGVWVVGGLWYWIYVGYVFVDCLYWMWL